MRNLKTVFASLFIASLTLFTSCDPDDDGESIDILEVLEYNSIQGFYEVNGIQDQNYTLNAVTGGSVIGENGTIVTFPANAFVDENDNPITGIVDVALKEIFTPSEMILSNKPTNALSFSNENTFLLSEGETEVRISQNGNSLHLANGINYQVSVPSAGGLDYEMLPFSGTTSDEEGIVWTPNGDVGVGGSGMEYVTAPASYIYDVFNTGWSNCDKFYNYPGVQTTNYINLINSPNAAETAIFLIFEENNLPAVVKFTTPYANGIQSYIDMLPEGLTVTYVAITVENNQQYLAMEEVIISDEEELTLNFELKSTQEILDALSILD
ncbi:MULTISPECIES: hypothetical protein [Winogradskyella]|uniref:hypothetical protein n=1 Tax=Winogradskyella TaxID=286104 RepID=UPI0015C8328B|nr:MULTISPECIES: hypothetical protein [Winogradskyella]QXP77725.1 hypothetical protein H0I32_10860 [Winogradskyella sp. HaHa_3_26]